MGVIPRERSDRGNLFLRLPRPFGARNDRGFEGACCRGGVDDLEGGGFAQTVSDGAGHSAALGTAGIDRADGGVVQDAQGGKEACRQRGGVIFLAVGQGVAACEGGQLSSKHSTRSFALRFART